MRQKRKTHGRDWTLCIGNEGEDYTFLKMHNYMVLVNFIIMESIERPISPLIESNY